MKASEAVAIIQRLINENGDTEICILDPEYGDTDEVVEISFKEGEIVIL